MSNNINFAAFLKIKQITQNITKLVTLLICLVSYVSAFPAAAQVEHKEGEGCFDVNKEFSWRFGLKAWQKLPIGIKHKHMIFGLSEHIIGPTVEWKPWNGIGLQLGLLYGYNN